MTTLSLRKRTGALAITLMLAGLSFGCSGVNDAAAEPATVRTLQGIWGGRVERLEATAGRLTLEVPCGVATFGEPVWSREDTFEARGTFRRLYGAVPDAVDGRAEVPPADAATLTGRVVDGETLALRLEVSSDVKEFTLLRNRQTVVPQCV